MQKEELLREVLKRKGTGPIGSKKVNLVQMKEVLTDLKDESINLNTRAVFWVACLVIAGTEEEQSMVAPYKNNPKEYLPDELQAISGAKRLEGNNQKFIDLIRRVIEMTDLDPEQLKQSLAYFWSDEIAPWIKGAFLQAMRLKGESITENFGFLQSMSEKVLTAEVDLPCLIDICDSYDGTNRSYHLAPFIAPTLAAMGVNCVIHGVHSIGPKYGITSHKLLLSADKSVNLSPQEAAGRITDRSIGWSYLDQSQSAPDIFALQKLRKDIQKRNFFNTFEKLLQPVRNKQGNVLFTGYVHTPYRERMVNLLCAQNRCHGLFAFHAIEGPTNCWIKKNTGVLGFRNETPNKRNQIPTSEILDKPDDEQEWLRSHGVKPLELELSPKEFGITSEVSEIDRKITIDQIRESALEAFEGKKGLVFDLLVFHAAAFYYMATGEGAPADIADLARKALNSGDALHHWNAYT
ncbi:MAG: hypothetical protein GY786_01255 [Proteobacteria bacterium]|nr:hypothetical protein [Pseudomonadota bacterium]